METRRPLFGQLISEKDYSQLDASFFRFSGISMVLIFVGNVLFTASVWLVNQLPFRICEKIAERLPDPVTVAVFAVALIVVHLALCTNIYVRAHKKDPYLLPALFANPCIAGLVFWFGRSNGIIGVGVGYLAGVTLVQAPIWMFVWVRSRQLWHLKKQDE